MKVNVDQFVMDSRRREWLWNYRRRHKLGFLVNRIQWYLYPKFHHVGRFPLHVDFEASSLCNMRCPMCFRPQRQDQNDGVMDFDLFRRAIDECAGHRLYSIRVGWRGEPTTCPHLIDMIAYAKQRGIPEVSFLTNGLRIEGDYAERLVRSGVDYLSISIDGLYEEYDRIRKPATFGDTLARVRHLRELRDTIGGGYPLLKVNTIWSQVASRAKEYYDLFSPLVDIISFNPDYDYAEKECHIDPAYVCQYPYQRLSVKWNGDVPMCISDWDAREIVGSIRDQSLAAIWRGDAMARVRRLHREHRIRELAPCCSCHRPGTVQVGNQRDIASRAP